ncbi:unnamed protein product, partial [Rotaria sp. Silwood2]
VPSSNEFKIKQAVPGNRQVIVTWDKIPEAIGYVLKYSLGSNIYVIGLDPETTSYTVIGLENGSTYYFKVMARSTTVIMVETSTILVKVGRTSGLQSHQLGLLVNDNDPDSIAVAEYYRIRRLIPSENIVHLSLPKVTRLTANEFTPLKNKVDELMPPTVQALALAWTIPYAVESMMLAGKNVDQVKALIDRGIASDGTQPTGSAYIMNTTDSIRSVRAKVFISYYLGKTISPHVNVQLLQANSISGTTDVLFYFQGLHAVNDITTNKYPPGAVADQLTLYGGMLTDSGSHMSILEFIAAGFTGSFGTVSEPCSWTQKFPNPQFMIQHYTKGETLIESYWKSILQVFQGVFVGEPLANPWRQYIS